MLDSYESNLHGAVSFYPVIFKRDCYIVIAVKLFTDDPGAKGIAVKSSHKIEHRSPVAGFDHSVIIFRT